MCLPAALAGASSPSTTMGRVWLWQVEGSGYCGSGKWKGGMWHVRWPVHECGVQAPALAKNLTPGRTGLILSVQSWLQQLCHLARGGGGRISPAKGTRTPWD
ncbi:hypothetical protein CLOM_g12011 [Closterium sp. NIES-68]|nr:hypothetical protein CLOM_g12011 [Closterium sp. NIES-68]GJP84593.1 hypothetical protein CLOP_g14649 [Closterium sp. NIES-67]